MLCLCSVDVGDTCIELLFKQALLKNDVQVSLLRLVYEYRY